MTINYEKTEIIYVMVPVTTQPRPAVSYPASGPSALATTTPGTPAGRRGCP